MRTISTCVLRLCCSLLVLSPVLHGVCRGDDTITIPRNRLAELEKQAAEVNRLKAALEAAEKEIARLKGAVSAPSAGVSQPPPRPVPVVAKLPPLRPGEVIQAVDLMNQFRADPVAAEQRYRKQKIRLQGEVVRLERPLLVSHYVILIRMEDSRDRLVCEVDQPEHFKTTFTVRNGEEMVGTLPSGGRVPIVKVGQTVVLQGKCRGLKDAGLVIGEAELVSVR